MTTLTPEPQVHRFTSGGCVIHRIRITGRAGRFSVWTDKHGDLAAAEQILESGTRPVVRNVKSDTPMWRDLHRAARKIVEQQNATQ